VTDGEAPPAGRDELDAAVRELERTAARLRTEEIEPEEAAELVERCAELAGRVGAALDREADARSAAAGDPGQERLL